MASGSSYSRGNGLAVAATSTATATALTMAAGEEEELQRAHWFAGAAGRLARVKEKMHSNSRNNGAATTRNKPRKKGRRW